MGRRAMARKRDAEEPGLSGEDAELWKHVTRDAKPLKKREAAKRAPVPEAPKPAPEPKTPDEAKPAPPEVVVKPARPKPPPPKPPVPELDHGGVAGVDKRSVARMKRGQMRIEARLDLHGHTQTEAHGELAAFDYAQPKHGGMGALYVLLRRKR